MAKTPVAGHVGDNAETPNIDDIIAQHSSAFANIQDDGDESNDLFDDDMDTDDEAEVGEETETAETTTPTGEGENSDDADDDDMSEDADGEEEESEDAEAKAETAAEGGIAGAIRYLEDNNPDFAKAVRELQGRLSRETADRSQFEKDREELSEILAEVRAAKAEEEKAQAAQEPEDDEENSVLAKIPEDQREVFVAAMQEYLEKHGYKNEDALNREEMTRAATEYVADAHKKAVEAFGEDFAAVDESGAIKMTKDNVPDGPRAEDMAAVRDRWSAPDKGVTWDDVYRIAAFDDAVKEAEERGYEKAKAELGKAARSKAAVKASTVNGSSSAGDTRPVIYDRKKEKGRIDPEDVYARAFRFAQRST